jgi:hypothetical protein
MNTPYFHGGNKGLLVGGYILPPSTTKVLSTSDYVFTSGNHRKDRVYVTTALGAPNSTHPANESRLYTKSSRKEFLKTI